MSNPHTSQIFLEESKARQSGEEKREIFFFLVNTLRLSSRGKLFDSSAGEEGMDPFLALSSICPEFEQFT